MGNYFRQIVFYFFACLFMYLNTPVWAIDTDGDGIDNEFDNCPTISNLDQSDENGDGVGETCSVYHCVTSSAELQQALTAAQSNNMYNIVMLEQGMYLLSENNGTRFTFDSSGPYGLFIGGGYLNQCSARVMDFENTILDGSNTDNSGILGIFSTSSFGTPAGSITVEGLTLKGGGGKHVEESNYPPFASGLEKFVHGGGINIITNTAAVSIRNNSIKENYPGCSVGSYDELCTGAGIYVHTREGAIELTENEITANYAASYGTGGGAYLWTEYNNINIIKNIIKGNMAYESGGGIFIFPSVNGTVTLADNIISNNDSWYDAGGGVLIDYGDLYGLNVVLTNNIINGNRCSSRGGGANIRSTKVDMINNTISGNYCYLSTGGLALSSEGVANIYNNIIWGNTRGNSGGGSVDELSLNSGSGTINFYNNLYDPAKTGMAGSINQANNMTADPQFVNSSAEDFHLKTSSPVINMGNNLAPLLIDKDFEGDQRIIGGITDIGADEYNSVKASFLASPPAGIVPLTVNLTDQSSAAAGSIVSWAWDFNADGIADSYLQNPSFTFNNIGKYKVSLTVTDSGGNSATVIGYVIAETDMDSDGVTNSSDNCMESYNPLQLDLDGDGLGDDCDDSIALLSFAGYTAGLKSSSAKELSVTDVTSSMTDGIFNVGTRVRLSRGKYDVMSFRSNFDAAKISDISLNMYVSGLYKNTPQIAKIYTYTADGMSVQTTNYLKITLTTGWNKLDLTSLLHLMDGYGFVKFRVTAAKNWIDISEVSFEVLADDWQISVNPSQLDFGSVDMGDSRQLSINVSNTGSGSLLITGVALPSAPFSVLSDNCSGKTLSAMSSCPMTVSFSPVASGTFSDTVKVLSNDADNPSPDLSLTGTGTVPPTYLTGTVNDASTGVLLSSVSLSVTDSSKTVSAQTDSNGIFSVSGLYPGGYTGIFSKQGYIDQTITGTLNPGQNTLNIQLSPIPPLLLSITSPSDGSISSSSSLTVTGQVTNNANVTVNRLQAAVSEGIFTAAVPVIEGVNTITAEATDQYGQTTSQSITVTVIFPKSPVISYITVTDVTADSSKITWSTDQASTSRVEYSETSAYGQFNEDIALTTTHIVGLTGLQPDTTYHFRVISTNDDGLSSSSGDNTFTTAKFRATSLGDFGNVTVMEVKGSYDAKNADGSVNELPRQEITKEYYKTHADDVDFFVIFSNFDFPMPQAEAKAFYLEVKNDVQGMGKALFDNSVNFGSNSKLQGTIDMGNISGLVSNPADPKFDEVIDTLAHEQMHRWGASVKFKDSTNNISSALLGKDGLHWSYLLDTDGSLMYGNDWKDNGNGTFTSVSASKYYSPLDMYLMGFYDKTQVPQILLIDNLGIDPTKLPEIGANISGTAKYVTIDNIIAAEGERVPNASSSQKAFKAAFIFITSPGTYTGNELNGIENIRNAWAGRFASLTSGKGTIADIVPNISIAISSPSNDDTISKPYVTVKGAFINNTGNETGVTINGMPATVYGNQFIVNHVPLTEGANTITVTATDTVGNTSTSTINVNAVTTGKHIRLISNIESGISPLEVSIRIDGSFSITSSDLNVIGPVQPEVISSSPEEYKLKFITEGVYFLTASSTGPDDVVYQDAITIIVLNKNQLDTLLKAKWEGMKGSLANGDIETASSYFTEESRQIYHNIFSGLSAYLPQIVQEFQPIQLIQIIENTAEYRIRRDELYGGRMVTMTYYIYFVIEKNGLWKIYRY